MFSNQPIFSGPITPAWVQGLTFSQLEEQRSLHCSPTLCVPLLNALLHRAPQLLSALSSFKLPHWVHRNQSVHAPWLTARPLHTGPEAPSQPCPPVPSALDNTSQWLSPAHAVWLSIFAKLTFFFCWNVPSFTLTHPPGCSWGVTSISRTAFLHALPVPRGLGAGLLSALLQLCPRDLPSAQLPLKLLVSPTGVLRSWLYGSFTCSKQGTGLMKRNHSVNVD